MHRLVLAASLLFATSTGAAMASTAESSMSLADWIVSIQLCLIAILLLGRRYGKRMTAWLEREEAQLDRARKEGLATLRRLEEEAAERDRIRKLANREMDRLALERQSRTTK